MTKALEGRTLQRPTREVLSFGSGRLSEALLKIKSGFVVVSQSGPLSALGEDALVRAGYVLDASSLDSTSLERLVSAVPRGPTIVGIGGGVVMDSAKWLAFSTGAPLILAPSILSVDACVTNTVAVRENGEVRYRGFVQADQIILDFDLVRSAPERLNRAGVGDLLSIHTALWDWKAGDRSGSAHFDDAVSRQATAILESAEAMAEAIHVVNDDALRAVLIGYANVNDLTVACGHAQMEEGSEHYLAYFVEKLTGRSYVHGELVTLGTILMSYLQDNEPLRIREIADRAGVEWTPVQLELSRQTLDDALVGFKEFAAQSNFPFSVVTEGDLGRGAIETLLDEVF